MASCNFNGGKKSTKTEVKASMRHNFRQNKNYSNQEINPELTPLNFDLTGRNYTQACSFLDQKIQELDQLPGQNKRKDRVILQEIVIATPERLPYDKREEWFREVYKIMEEFNHDTYTSKDKTITFAAEIVYASVHVDERHSYIDARTGMGKISRAHAHFGSLVTDSNGKFCGKFYSARARIQKLNKEIDRMSQERFGVKFMDGTQAKHLDTVEHLKIKSQQEELIRRRRECQEMEQKKRAVLQEIEDLEKNRDVLRAQPSNVWEALWQFILDLLERAFGNLPNKRELAELRAVFDIKREEITGRDR